MTPLSHLGSNLGGYGSPLTDAGQYGGAGPGAGPGPGKYAAATFNSMSPAAMSEMDQHQRQMGIGMGAKDPLQDPMSGGWGPRELPGDNYHDYGHGGLGGGQGQNSGAGPYEVLTSEKAAEMPVQIEAVELSSGWEDMEGNQQRGDGSNSGDRNGDANRGGGIEAATGTGTGTGTDTERGYKYRMPPETRGQQ